MSSVFKKTPTLILNCPKHRRQSMMVIDDQGEDVVSTQSIIDVDDVDRDETVETRSKNNKIKESSSKEISSLPKPSSLINDCCHCQTRFHLNSLTLVCNYCSNGFLRPINLVENPYGYGCCHCGKYFHSLNFIEKLIEQLLQQFDYWIKQLKINKNKNVLSNLEQEYRQLKKLLHQDNLLMIRSRLKLARIFQNRMGKFLNYCNEIIQTFLRFHPEIINLERSKEIVADCDGHQENDLVDGGDGDDKDDDDDDDDDDHHRDKDRNENVDNRSREEFLKIWCDFNEIIERNLNKICEIKFHGNVPVDRFGTTINVVSDFLDCLNQLRSKFPSL
ncbi:hypothetical protein NH340_JMT05816 [Sarcoptes scabiei]|nr:hypothetical protein NH340_JMT05816 [Sarcoptes scabiei]